MKRNAMLFFVFLTLTVKIFAQTEATQYFMNSLPQVSINNPAFFPKYRFSIGLPVLSSIATTYTNNGFTYNDLIRHSNGKTIADVGQWNNALTSRNYISNSTSVDLARIGVSVGSKIYLQLSSSAKEYSRLLIPRELTSLVAQGNAIGTTNFSPRAEGMGYLEFALSTAIKVNKKLSVGVRLKYLKGIMDATTINSAMSVTTTPDYSVTGAADLRLRTSGVYDASQKGYSFGSQFKNYMSNSGEAIDLGATYTLTDRISLAASIVDFGKISWKNNTYDYVLNKATANYTFSGIDADKLVQGNTTYLGAQGDSISKRFVFQKQKSASYSTWLPGKIYLSGSYSLAKNLKAGLLVFSEKYQNRFSHGVSASLNKNVGKWLSTVVSYTVSNNSFNNFGAGISLNFKPVQIYVVGDNLLNAPASLITTQHLNSYINNTQVFSLRVGLNFVWGLTKEVDREKRRLPRGKKTPGYLKARKKS